MKKCICILFLSLIFLLFAKKSTAQSVQGCVLPGSNIVYTNQVSGSLTTLINFLLGGAPLYHTNPNQHLTNPNCYYKAIGSSRPCKICPTGFTTNTLGLITGCSSTLLTGQEGTYIVECDLDSYSLALLSLVGFFGIRFIKKRA